MSKAIHRITIVGLGPGSIGQLTLEAAEVLQSAERIYLRTVMHPNVEALRVRFPHLEIQSFDDIYESSAGFEEVYGAIVARIVDLAVETEVIYCVPGSPSIGETTVDLLRALSSSMGVLIRVVQGVSFVEASLGALGDADTSWLQIMDGIDLDLLASQNAVGEIQGSPGTLAVRMPVPTSGLLIHQVHSRQVATSVKLWLSKYWPDQHEVCLIRDAGTPDETVTRLPLLELDRVEVDHLTT
ncbi:MAG TPA: SAM-dependent methyltransferase, partial [Chloroflexota bacterium]|nr:SAM-dependent methyltransferase [Chloroflexota bacterium]